jgi:hypothetical protein
VARSVPGGPRVRSGPTHEIRGLNPGGLTG